MRESNFGVVFNGKQGLGEGREVSAITLRISKVGLPLIGRFTGEVSGNILP